MKYTFLSIFLLASVLLSAQERVRKSFDDLTTLVFSQHDEEITESISYDKEISKVINVKYKDLPKSDPFYMEECDGEIIKLLRTKIDKSSDKYYTISYNPNCCCPYGYKIYKDNNPHKIIGEITAARILIPGNGAIYTDGRIWGNFNKRQKFILSKDTIKEVKQPFNYVGLFSKTKSTINLYYEKDLKNLIATIPANYEIEVLLNDKSVKDLYLVRTSFGIVGWTKLQAEQYQSKDVEGIYYWGD